MKKHFIASLGLAGISFFGGHVLGEAAPSMDSFAIKELKTRDISWDSLGTYSADSMPLGNGDIGLNVWTEQNGDILFYISKTDAWDENNELVKVGRVRITLTPNPFATGNQLPSDAGARERGHRDDRRDGR